MKKYLMSLAVAVCAASALVPATSYAGGFDLRVSSGNAFVGIDLGYPPPAPRVEVLPPPRMGYVWAPGYWVWRGHGHQWVEGRWVSERPGYAYVTPTWERRGERWHYEPERWQENRYYARREQHGNGHGHGHHHDDRD